MIYLHQRFSLTIYSCVLVTSLRFVHTVQLVFNYISTCIFLIYSGILKHNKVHFRQYYLFNTVFWINPVIQSIQNYSMQPYCKKEIVSRMKNNFSLWENAVIISNNFIWKAVIYLITKYAILSDLWSRLFINKQVIV